LLVEKDVAEIASGSAPIRPLTNLPEDLQGQRCLVELKSLDAKLFTAMSVAKGCNQASADGARMVRRGKKFSPYPKASVAKDIAFPRVRVPGICLRTSRGPHFEKCFVRAPKSKGGSTIE